MGELRPPGSPGSRPLVVFGTGPLAKVVHQAFSHDTPREVVAFTVDASHRTADAFLGLPLVPFADVARLYPPVSHDMFIAIGYRRMNALRAERCAQARELGYELPTYVSTRASIWPGLEIGDNCLVMDQVAIHPFARVGSDNILWTGCHIGHESVVMDHCWISSHAVVSGFATIESRCFLGSNATVRDAVTVASECVVGAGAVILKDTRPREVYAAASSRLLPISSDRLPNL